jgi:hypothetical protein
MRKGPHMRVHCFLCKRPFEFGPPRSEGRRIDEWNVMVCYSCRTANWDGIPPLSYPHLIDHLRWRGIDIQLNRFGRISWPTP